MRRLRSMLALTPVSGYCDSRWNVYASSPPSAPAITTGAFVCPGVSVDVIAANETALRDLWRHTPHLSVWQAAHLPWGADRNLALRKALGIPFPSPVVVQQTVADVIQIVHNRRQRAESIANILRTDLPGWTVTTHRNSDGNHVIQAHR